MLVRHASVEAFWAVADNRAYLAGIGHRVAPYLRPRFARSLDKRRSPFWGEYA
jgi:hypothetical protein